MLDYNKRLNDAWAKVPTHRQKEILEDLEHKVAVQQFSSSNLEDSNSVKSSDSEDNILEPLVDLLLEGVTYMCIKLGIVKASDEHES